ncbi:MAG: hypothetical protein U0610_21890 [bacterium]
MDARNRASQDVAVAAEALERAYRALIDHWKAERALLARPEPGRIERATIRESEILAAIAAEEAHLRRAGDALTRVLGVVPPAPGSPTAASGEAPTLLVLVTRLDDPAARQRLRDALVSLRETVRTARALGKAQAQFVERGLHSLQDALSRWARESRPLAGYGDMARHVPAAASGTFVRETA